MGCAGQGLPGPFPLGSQVFQVNRECHTPCPCSGGRTRALMLSAPRYRWVFFFGELEAATEQII